MTSKFRHRVTFEKSPLSFHEATTANSLSSSFVQEEETLNEKSIEFSKDRNLSFRYLTNRQFHVTMLCLITILAFLTRFHRIEQGSNVIWDEAHFGKFASHYLKREFYTDVHPPLGKMLIGLAGYLNGYNGTWDFNSGSDYPDWVDYVGMRKFLASFGALAIPFAYMTAVALELSQLACVLVALCMLFDNGYVGICRLILLDSMLLFFTVTSTLGLALSVYYRSQPFSKKWWASMVFTGVNIGLVSSIKWVGFFDVALVGLHAVRDLLQMIGDINIPKFSLVKHFLARCICLIFIPILIYVSSFYIHFAILTHSGPGDAQMSSLFQAGLIGNDIAKSPYEVSFGSVITIRNRAANGGLLHSHIQVYPEGSLQHQVTGYHHKDINNNFIVKKPHPPNALNRVEGHSSDPNLSEVSSETGGFIEFLKHGDTLRLVHSATGGNLHSHKVPAHMTKGDYEVSTYGNDTLYSDPNDHWILEVQEDQTSVPNELRRLRSLTTIFKLRHVFTGCYLSGSKASYPEWGFNQIEITCQPNNKTDRHVLWNVESHWNDLLPPGDPYMYKSSFWSNLIDVNINMWRTNQALVLDKELEPSTLTSSALEWPFLLTGIRMNSFDPSSLKFYMAGNPIVWWLSGVSLIVTAISLALIIMARKRQLVFPLTPSRYLAETFLLQAQIALGGWILHYLPFFIMGRVLYLHHYYPALFFAILVLAILYDRMVFPFGFPMHLKDKFYLSSVWQKRSISLFLALAIPIVVTFIIFMPICYGITAPAHELDYLRWVSSWPL